MTQDAVVTKILSDKLAEVAVSRGTACGSNCGNCESCIFQSEIKTVARNKIKAARGQKVVIESSSKKVYGAIILVYIVPIVLLVLGFALGSAAGLGEVGCVLCSFIGLIVGAAIVVASQRLKKNNKSITFDIVSLRD